MILYKYKTINKQNIDDLKIKKIYYPNPILLNDPFDCKAEIYSNSFGIDAEDIINTNIVIGFLHAFNHQSILVSEPKRKHMLTELKKTKTSKAAVKLVQQFIYDIGLDYELMTLDKRYKEYTRQINEFGVLSLTEDPANMLMWSHYGDQHKGMVLGFDIDENENCKKVNYTDDFPKIDMDTSQGKFTLNFKNPQEINSTYTINITDSLAQTIFYNKAKCWEYEKEWRIIVPKYGLSEFPGRLTEIIFGCRCSDQNKREIKESINDKTVKMKEINISNNSFKLFIN